MSIIVKMAPTLVWLTAALQFFSVLGQGNAQAVPQAASFPAGASTSSSTPLQVDLGYAIYKGASNSTTGLNTWKG